MNNNAHYFIGIPIQSGLKEQLSKWQSKLQQDVSYRVWTFKDDFHITLKFLGATDKETVQQLINLLQQIQLPSFQLPVAGLGFFGKREQPRVMWAGVGQHKALTQLQHEVENTCVQLGMPRENRPYRPHITLAKKWNEPKKKIDQDKVKNQIEVTENQLYVNHFSLFQIHMNRQQKYEEVKIFPLLNK
ncbi:RNA 2',3'-cyclic phosphodiesterase [Salirhabdus salicampi]|uniref:RNA 2',3'-cyclic phosphodiesterase n=1 Tax=Salirhabdus salicampi TaxID=476102 RepID=UPI0020C43ACD|nr:RNA 2',3'-cyclic phosphodiesterase [Salirhabdus salicampi]MCP8617164.1 RNA 2',3'-cyclic phosphodiesterase [Salirhabdus salicampi]